MDLLTEVREARRTPPLPPPAEARLIRQTAGVSQARLAQELSVHRMTVVHWENGTRKPQGLHRRAYAQLLEQLRAAIAS